MSFERTRICVAFMGLPVCGLVSGLLTGCAGESPRPPAFRPTNVHTVMAVLTAADGNGGVKRLCSEEDLEALGDAARIELSFLLYGSSSFTDSTGESSLRTLGFGDLIETAGGTSKLSGGNLRASLGFPNISWAEYFSKSTEAPMFGQVKWHAPKPDARMHLVSVVVDNSASMFGRLRAEGAAVPYEASPDEEHDFRLEWASDRMNFRTQEAVALVGRLPEDVRVLTYTLGEVASKSGVPTGSLACNSPGFCSTSADAACLADSDCPLPSDFCFGPYVSAYRGLSRIEALRRCMSLRREAIWGIESQRQYFYGRAPVWQTLIDALEDVQILRDAGDVGTAEIVVLIDGADTCGADADFFTAWGETSSGCALPCGKPTSSFEAVRSRLGGIGEVEVHFVQLASIASPKPIARYQQLACETGGTYKFLDLKSASEGARSQLERAMRSIVDSGRGMWVSEFEPQIETIDRKIPLGAPGTLSGAFSVSFLVGANATTEYDVLTEGPIEHWFSSACLSDVGCGALKFAPCRSARCASDGSCEASAKDGVRCSDVFENPGVCCAEQCAAVCDVGGCLLAK